MTDKKTFKELPSLSKRVLNVPFTLIAPAANIATGALVLATMTAPFAIAVGGLAVAYGGFTAVENSYKSLTDILTIHKAKKHADKNKAYNVWSKHRNKLAKRRLKLSRTSIGMIGALGIFSASIALLTTGPALPLALLAGYTIITSSLAGIGNTIGFVGNLGVKAVKNSPEGKKLISEIKKANSSTPKSIPSPSKPGFDKAAKKSAPAANQNKPESPAAKPQRKNDFK